MLGGKVTGRAELRRIQADVAKVPASLKARVVDGIRGALTPLKVEIPKAAGVRMPHRGGYASVLSRATKVTVRVLSKDTVTGTASVTAPGKSKQRDIESINKGILRHPTFGRRGKGDWHAQRVRPKFIDDPFDDAVDRAAKAMEEAINDTADDLERG